MTGTPPDPITTLGALVDEAMATLLALTAEVAALKSDLEETEARCQNGREHDEQINDRRASRVDDLRNEVYELRSEIDRVRYEHERKIESLERGARRW